MRNLGPAISALSLLIAGSALAQTGPMRDYQVTSPVPSNAVDPGAGGTVPAGSVRLRDNMPGHRRYRPPQFPRAGWDSPILPNGERDYDHYLREYWKAPFMAADARNADVQGQEQRGYVAPEPWTPKVERSRATPEQEALMERRMAFLTREVLNAAPFRNLHGASIEPELLIHGYGEQYGAQGNGVMQGDIVLAFRLILPNTGKTERMPNGTIRSTGFGPTLRIQLNPQHLNCLAPEEINSSETRCTDGRVLLATDRRLLAATGSAAEPRREVAKAGYADGRPADDIRLMYVWHDRQNNAASEIPRGRMHPNDALGRIIGAMSQIDWPDLLRRANEVR